MLTAPAKNSFYPLPPSPHVSLLQLRCHGGRVSYSGAPAPPFTVWMAEFMGLCDTNAVLVAGPFFVPLTDMQFGGISD